MAELRNSYNILVGKPESKKMMAPYSLVNVDRHFRCA
jgi:hypothetical protein